MMIKKSFDRLLNHHNAQKIIDIFEQAGHEIRFVGGAVRDCMAGREIRELDIDMATPLEPHKVINLLQQHRIRVIPTGIKYGTVTVLVGKQSFEITTLRKDMATDGRRAMVSYTDDWFEDATRRDFTINAMSLKPNGELFDPFDGERDLKRGDVKFIGDAERRINEDALRILRFFRFHSLFGKGRLDNDALNACLENRGLLDNLSAERVRQELLKLLLSEKAAVTWNIMLDNAILANVVPHACHVLPLEKVIMLEEMFHCPSPMRRFISLYRPDGIVVTEIASRFQLTKADTVRFDAFKRGIIPPDLALMEERDMLPYLYRFGKQITLDGIILGLARSKWKENAATFDRIKQRLMLIRDWEKPTFPLSGQDVMDALSLQQGKQLGDILKACENMWIDNTFNVTSEELLAWAKDKFFPEDED